MQVKLGDRITLGRGDTRVTGTVSGLVLKEDKQTDRVYVENVAIPFYTGDGWECIGIQEQTQEVP